MNVLLVATYELGHQPVNLARPAAALTAAGHDVRCLDLSVERWDDAAIEAADVVAVSVPMHTAMRLALEFARRARERRPDLPLCLYGLYAGVSRELTSGRLADRLFAGEYVAPLVEWVNALAAGDASSRAPQPAPQIVDLRRDPASSESGPPVRSSLPPLEKYARLEVGGETRLAGSVEASRGCSHRCRHCPVPVVYDGRVRVVAEDTVLADVAQVVAAGARHVTFEDPDFLNAPAHARRVARMLHERFSEVTFDCTTKVAHILRHESLWPELASAGCLFVVTAIESVDDDVLRVLDKGHTRADAAASIRVLRSAGIEPRPTFLPFTPWTTPQSIVELLDFVIECDLIGNVDPIQYTIRLLVPEGSLLLAAGDLAPHLVGYDSTSLTWEWRYRHPRADALQRAMSAIVARGADREEPPSATFLHLYAAAREAAGLPEAQIDSGSVEGRPRLTEPWFC